MTFSRKIGTDFSRRPKASRSVAKANILLVDDRPDQLQALQVVLEQPDYHLVQAASGEDALRLALEADFAVILLDVRMAGLDGLETAAHLRNRERSRQTPIIFLTGWEMSADQIVEVYAVGAVDYIFKPVQAEVLRAKVGVFVELYRARHEQELQVDERTAELRQANEDLRESSQKLDDFFENGAVGLHWVGPDEVILKANRAELDLFGYRPEEYVGRHISEFHVDRDA